MDRIINLRIPHIGEKIFECMDISELIESLYVSKTWRHLAESIFLKRCAETDEYGRTPLVWASVFGYTSLVRNILDIYQHENVDLTAKSPSGKTALMYACQRGNDDIVKSLLELLVAKNQLDIPGLLQCMQLSDAWKNLARSILMERCKEVDEEGITPLLWASIFGYTNLVDDLLDCACRLHLNAKCPKGRTALMYACEAGNKSAVVTLVSSLANMNNSVEHLYDQDAEEMTPLMIACSNGHTEVFKFLLDLSGKLHITHRSFHMSANTFELACRIGHTQMVKMMLDHWASPELYKKGTKGIPFLRGFVEAWNHVQIDVIRLMCINPYGKSFFEFALRKEDYNIIQLLISKSDELDIDWKTAIKKLERVPGLEDIVQILIDDCNTKDAKGLTPIMRACQYGHHELAKHLLKQNDIDLNVKDWNGLTVLMRECKAGNDATVQILLDHTINTNGHTHLDFDVRDLDGCTAFILACRSGHERIAGLLTFYAEMGCNIDLNIKSKSGDTGLKIVCQQGHTDIVKQLLQFKDITVPTRKDFQKAWFSIKQRIQEMLEEKWKSLTNELGDVNMTEVDNSVTCDEWMEDLEYMDDSDVSNEDISDEDEE